MKIKISLCLPENRIESIEAARTLLEVYRNYLLTGLYESLDVFGGQKELRLRAGPGCDQVVAAMIIKRKEA